MPHHSRATPRAGPAADLALDSAHRTVTDRHGRVWAVREGRTPREDWTPPEVDSYRHGYGVGWLLFELGADARKRLRLYPARWDRLPEGELERLCDRARRF